MKLTNILTGTLTQGKLLKACLLAVFILGTFVSIRSCVQREQVAAVTRSNTKTSIIDSVKTAERRIVIDSLKGELKKGDSLRIVVNNLKKVNTNLTKQNEKNRKKYDSLNAVLRWVLRPRF